MKSCLYELSVMHDRRKPKHYRFENKIFMFYLDLSEIEAIAQKTRLFGHNQNRVYNYRENDHIGDVRDYLRSKGLDGSVVNIRLLTNVRSFGHIFNPVSFYYCFGPDDKPVCVVVEIGNTFGELKYFFLGPEKRSQKSFEDRQTKYYYISPFTELDNVLDFDIQVPDERLEIGIDVLKQGERFLFTGMRGRRVELTTQNLLWCSIKYPLITVKVIFLIHWHAAILHFIKKINHHAKEENPELQRDL